MTAFRRTIPEQAVAGQRLGRHVHHDPRSRHFVAETTATIKSVNHASVGLPLDQGNVGSCTAEALCSALNTAPDHGSVTRTQADAIMLYELETKLEGRPFPQFDPGGSGLMVCKAAKQLGWIRKYSHAFSFSAALRALVLRPVIFGVNWYSSFDSPDSEGVVSLGGFVRGGHEVCAVEIDTARSLVGFWNSWGASYGVGGRFYMPFDVVDRLLHEQGDCTVPVVWLHTDRGDDTPLLPCVAEPEPDSEDDIDTRKKADGPSEDKQAAGPDENK